MPSSISDFKQILNQEFQKTSLMEVEIFPPGASNLEYFKYTCEASQLPGFTFTTEERDIMGLKSEIPINFGHEKLQLSFLCSSSMTERKFFDAWFKLIHNPETSTMGYYDTYVGEIIVRTFDDIGNPSYVVKYLNCYPNTLTSQNLTWAETNVLRLTVDFSYEKWIPVSEDDQK